MCKKSTTLFPECTCAEIDVKVNAELIYYVERRLLTLSLKVGERKYACEVTNGNPHLVHFFVAFENRFDIIELTQDIPYHYGLSSGANRSSSERRSFSVYFSGLVHAGA